MTKREIEIIHALVVLQREKECVLRQDTPECNRDCKNCNLVLPTEEVVAGYDTAIEILKNAEISEHKCETCIDAEGFNGMCSECLRVCNRINWRPKEGGAE